MIAITYAGSRDCSPIGHPECKRCAGDGFVEHGDALQACDCTRCEPCGETDVAVSLDDDGSWVCEACLVA